jgi:replicative DNA helicase
MHSPDTIPRQISGPTFDLPVVGGIGLPHSPQAEMHLLASILADDSPTSWALSRAAGVKPKAFHIVTHATIWTAIDALNARGVAAVSIVEVAEELQITGLLNELGGIPALSAISARMVLPTHTRFLAEQVVLLWHLRHAINLAAELREAAVAFTAREDFVSVASDIGQRLLRLGLRNVTKSLAEEIAEVEADVTARATGKDDRTRWISSGLPLFDEKCKRFTGGREDQLVVFAGGSGMGKSVALRQLGGAALLQGKRVLSFSRETSTAGFVEMLVASWTSLDLNNLETTPRDRLTEFQTKAREMREQWADKLLFCVQHTPATPLLTIEDLENATRAFVNLRGQPDVILVDYIQLFGTEKRFGSREETVATISHRLQALVRELPGTTMFAAAQLNESGLDEMRQIRRETNADGTEGKVIHRLPKPGDIRESQAIYHDADRVVFLYRPPVDCRDVDQRSPTVLKPEVWWYQEKRRRGGVGIVRTWFEKRYTRFIQVDRGEHMAADEAQQTSGGQVPTGGMDKGAWKKKHGGAK